MRLLAGLGVAFLVVAGSSTAAAVEWREIKAEHFTVYYKNAPAKFVDNTLARCESIYKQTASTLGFTRYKGWIGNSRVKVYVYDNAEAFKQSTGFEWASGSVVTGLRTIAAFPAAQGFFDSTLPHEIGHIIFRDFIGAEARVPLWFEEGVAMQSEESGRWGSDDDVRGAIEAGRFISLADMTSLALNKNSDPELVRVFYAEAASLVSFLIKEGEIYRFARLCREIKDGTPFEWSVKKSYMKYSTLERLEESWKGYLIHEKSQR